MSTLKTKNLQIGTSGVESDNYNFYQTDVPDGNLYLVNGNSGSSSDIVFTVDGTSSVTFVGSVTAQSISAAHTHVLDDITDLDVNEDLSKWSTFDSSGIFYNDGNVGIGASDASESLDVVGNVKATGDFISLSDVSLKRDVEPVVDALSIVDGLQGVFYRYHDDESNRRHVGLIAQEVESVLPEVVYDYDGLKSVSYANIVSVLIEAVKTLREEVEELRNGVSGVS